MATATLQLRSRFAAAQPGEGRRLALEVPIEPLELGGERYGVEPVAGAGAARRLAHDGRRLRAAAALHRRRRGPCMRCLSPAAPPVEVDAREVDVRAPARSSTAPTWRRAARPGAWARDALALAMPAKSSAARTAPGCARCARPTSRAGPEHHHEQAPDPALGEAARAATRVAARRAWLVAFLARMAVPKQKQSHSRTAKRRAQHKIAADDQRLPALPQPAAAAPGLPGVRHLRRSRGRRSAPEHDHDHDHS